MKCQHDWVIHPDSADEQKHTLCSKCKCWIPTEDDKCAKCGEIHLFCHCGCNHDVTRATESEGKE